MHALKAILLRFGFFVFLPLSLMVLGVWLHYRKGLPTGEQTMALQGLSGEVLVTRDADGVPTIQARSDRDAFFALGYLHAQDRMWQLEILRTLGAGEMSKKFSPELFSLDATFLTYGLYRAGVEAWDHLDEQAKASIEAETAGINAWLSNPNRVLPLEFRLFGVDPKPWSVHDSMVLSKLMAHALSGNMRQDFLRAFMVEELDPELLGRIFPDYPQEAPTTMRAPTVSASSQKQPDKTFLEYWESYMMPKTAIGSNAWVVSGRHTRSGKPLLANDIHLEAKTPSAWYLAHLRGERLAVSGATLPGLPYVVFGSNANIAWGGTNMVADTQDIYYERIEPNTTTRVEYEGKWENLKILHYRIPQRAQFPDFLREPQPDQVLTVRISRNGPIISDLESHHFSASYLGAPYSLRWTVLDPDDTSVSAILRLNYASNWDEFNAALADYVAPALNFLYADQEGNIGFLGAGRIPIRAEGNGSLPRPGWNGSHGWTGYIPFAELPRAYNPPEGYLVTANNRNIPASYPYHITSDWEPHYRATRIQQLIQGKIDSQQKLSVEDMIAIQGDYKCLQALEILPHLLQFQPRNERQAKALAILRPWDGIASMDSSATAIYEAWLLFLGPEMLSDNVPAPVRWYASEVLPEYLKGLVQSPADPTCDDLGTAAVESCPDILSRSLDKALNYLERKLGGSMEDWEWGKIHKLIFEHDPGSRSAMGRMLFNNSIPNGGTRFSVNVGTISTRPYHQLEQYFTTSYRQIVEPGNGTASMFMLTPGQSANPMSPHYNDLMERHRDLQFLSMAPGSAATSTSQLKLIPQSTQGMQR